MRLAAGRTLDFLILAALAAGLVSLLAGGLVLPFVSLRSTGRPLIVASILLLLRHLVFRERRRGERAFARFARLGLAPPSIMPVLAWIGLGGAVGLADAARIGISHSYLAPGGRLLLLAVAAVLYAATAMVASIPIGIALAATDRLGWGPGARDRFFIATDLFVLTGALTLTGRRAMWSLPADAPPWLPGIVMLAAFLGGAFFFLVLPLRLRRSLPAALGIPLAAVAGVFALGWFLTARPDRAPAAIGALERGPSKRAAARDARAGGSPGQPPRGTSIVTSPSTQRPGSPGERAGPNLLLVTVDTLRADALGCYGSTTVRTPVLDALAASGTRFADVTTAIPETAPSHASILASRYPLTTGMRANGSPYLDPSPTLAEILRSRGYHTAAFVSGYVLKAHMSGLDRGFEVYDDTFSRFEELPGLMLMRLFDRIGLVTYVDLWKIWAERRAGETNVAAGRWLEAQRGEGPFFLWVHYFDPHGPYDPPSPWDRMYYTGNERDPSNLSMRGVRIDHPYQEKPGVTDREFWVACYRGEVSYTDNRLGDLLGRLEKLGLAPTTLVGVTADHGESLTEHGAWFTHGENIFQPTASVPMILSQPGRLATGVVHACPAATIDLAPTIIDLLGLPGVPTFRGRSLAREMGWQAAAGPGATCDRPLYIEGQPTAARAGVKFADENAGKPLGVRSGPFKFIRTPGEGDALYDISTSPIESISILDRDTATAAALRQLLEGWLAHESQARRATPGGLDDSERERLRSLGYLR